MAREMTAREIIELVLKQMSQGGSGGGGAGNILLGSLVNGPGRNEATANGYPEEFVPDGDHYYDVVFAPEGQHNSRGSGDPNVALGGTMQTLEQHREALNKYVRPGMTPAQLRDAINAGREEEKLLPQFWAESKTRPSGRFTVGSSAVKGIRITPDGHVEIKWNGKPSKKNRSGWYTFGAFDNPHDASIAAVKLMQMPSIGRAVMPWQRNGKPLNFKQQVPGMCIWNREYYNGSYAE